MQFYKAYDRNISLVTNLEQSALPRILGMGFGIGIGVIWDMGSGSWDIGYIVFWIGAIWETVLVSGVVCDIGFWIGVI